MCRTHTFTEPRASYDVWLFDTDFDLFEGECEDDGEFDDFDCGMGPDGLCMNAGTEWCDWECPMNRAAHMRSRIAAGKAVML
jgi:hypothetical protein